MRWVVGLLLVFAAVLKAAQLVIEPTAALVGRSGSLLLPTQVGVELGVGLLVLSGLYWRQLRWLALCLFTSFATYSFYLAVVGAASCGCFGPVEVHPWWAFWLDVAVVLGLLISIGRCHPSSTSWWQGPGWIHRHTVAMTIVGISVVSIALLVRHASPRTATTGDLPTRTGNLVILEPGQWIGKLLPIADAIDLDLTEGRWIVLLHRHDCPECQAAVPRYEELAIQQPVALVEVPPYADSHDAATGPANRARLSNDREWFVQTPVEIRLQDGVVLAVKFGDGE